MRATTSPSGQPAIDYAPTTPYDDSSRGLFVTADGITARRPTFALWTPTEGIEEPLNHLLRPGPLRVSFCGLDVSSGEGTWRVPWTIVGPIEKRCEDVIYAEFKANNFNPEMGASPEPGEPDATDQAAMREPTTSPAP